MKYSVYNDKRLSLSKSTKKITHELSIGIYIINLEQQAPPGPFVQNRAGFKPD